MDARSDMPSASATYSHDPRIHADKTCCEKLHIVHYLYQTRFKYNEIINYYY